MKDVGLFAEDSREAPQVSHIYESQILLLFGFILFKYYICILFISILACDIWSPK